MVARGLELRIALPTGRLQRPVLELFARAGLSVPDLGAAARRLVLPAAGGRLSFLLAKPADVHTYVEYGAADLGVVGKDVLLEDPRDVSELLDLRLLPCSVVVAAPVSAGIASVEQVPAGSRVATKYPRLATRFFNGRGIQVEIVPLHGSIEVAPLVGLAEVIVDITQTGRTLKANGLEVVAPVAASTARLVANPVRHRVRYEAVEELVQALEAALAASPAAAR